MMIGGGSMIVAYIRVSTVQQGESGLGLEAQKNLCIEYSKKHNIEIREIFSDVNSGSLPLEKRNSLILAVNALQKGDILLVARRDRIGRDMMNVAMIEAAVAKKKARLISVAGEATERDDPSSYILRKMIDLFAEYERLIGAMRITAALQTKKAKNERVGRIPYGKKLAEDGIHLEENEDEKKVVNEMTRLYNEYYSFREMARILNENGFSNREGTKWNCMSVNRIFRASKNILTNSKANHY